MTYAETRCRRFVGDGFHSSAIARPASLGTSRPVRPEGGSGGSGRDVAGRVASSAAARVRTARTAAAGAAGPSPAGIRVRYARAPCGTDAAGRGSSGGNRPPWVALHGRGHRRPRLHTLPEAAKLERGAGGVNGVFGDATGR